MKQSEKKNVKKSAVKILSIILGILMVVGALLSMIVVLLPAPKLEKYENKKLTLVSVVCEFSGHSSALTASNKEKILNDMREKSGKKNADETELMEWYAKTIKKDIKKNKLTFTTDSNGTYRVVKYGDNEYRYSVNRNSSNAYTSFSISGATEALNGTYTVDTNRKKITHESHGDYVLSDGTELHDVMEIIYYYKK